MTISCQDGGRLFRIVERTISGCGRKPLDSHPRLTYHVTMTVGQPVGDLPERSRLVAIRLQPQAQIDLAAIKTANEGINTTDAIHMALRCLASLLGRRRGS